VGGVVVEDEVQVEIVRVLANELVEELDELLMAVAAPRTAATRPRNSPGR
jgi:hypothetical protein